LIFLKFLFSFQQVWLIFVAPNFMEASLLGLDHRTSQCGNLFMPQKAGVLFAHKNFCVLLLLR
jgi:hypothetical protein